jgi:hypothetical protein
MKQWMYTYRYEWALFLILVLATILVQPFGNFPLNDDWAYAKPLVGMLNGQKFSIGECPAMTLVTHLLWGALFAKVGGFSFEILRLSSLVASFIGLIVLFKIIKQISSNPLLALLGSMVYLFTPVYFNLSYTFMTEITFSTWLLCGCYFAFRYFNTGSKAAFFYVYFFSLLLLFNRQFGIMLPLSFLGINLLFDKQKKWSVTLGLIFIILLVMALKWYEGYLHQVLPENASYKYSGGINPFMRVFWDNIFKNARLRYATVLLHSFIFILPFALFFFIPLWKQTPKITRWLALMISFPLAYFLFQKEPFPMGNIFVNMHLGAETFFECLSQETTNYTTHTRTEWFNQVSHWTMITGMAGMIMILFFLLHKLWNGSANPGSDRPGKFFIWTLFGFYTLLIFLTESYFDRYHVPLIVLGIILVSFFSKGAEPYFMPGVTVILLLVYISVAGTKDYFTVQTKKWEAYAYLRDTMKVEKEEINGGYELNGWNEGKPSAWYQFLFLKDYKYLIQYSPEPGFRLLKSYEFRRCFPFKKDKINIFVKDSIKTYD